MVAKGECMEEVMSKMRGIREGMSHTEGMDEGWGLWVGEKGAESDKGS